MFEPAILQRIRLVGLDVDGVLTDGGLYLGELSGAMLELKRFDVRDGLGIRMLQRAGMRVAWVSGRRSAAVEVRAKELGVEDLVQQPRDGKLAAFSELVREKGLELSECAFIGDDLPDLEVLAVVGLAIAVADAAPEVQAAAHWCTRSAGGRGAVREAAEAILKGRGVWDDLLGGASASHPGRGAVLPAG
jgi:3-deoxy-D-manno-octulosonate 8-phosphate phosphatase (KDO 8-P phosphatase)